MAARRSSLDDIAGHLRPVSASPAEALAEALELTPQIARGAFFCDVDGVLAPIVQRPEDAHVREETSVLLGRLARRYACVACISGRAAADVRRLVGVGGIAYAGSHGAELLEPARRRRARCRPSRLGERVKRFAADRDTPEARAPRPDRGQGTDRRLPLARRPRRRRAHAARGPRAGGRDGRLLDALGPQGARGPAAGARSTRARRCATWSAARVPAPRSTAATTRPTSDAFSELEALISEDVLDAAVRVGVSSDEGPRAIVERADLVVDGVEEFSRVLTVLADVAARW